MAPKTAYCPSCGHEVEPFVMLAERDETMRCPDCGLELHDTGGSVKTLDHVIVAEDSGALRNKIAEILQGQKMARHVIQCVNGDEFIASFTEEHLAGRTPRLAILDVNMPVINGINAAITMRAIEHGYDFPKATPLLFFTSKVCDETFKKVLAYTKPAKYINKGTGTSPDEFAGRLASVLSKLLAA